jgi:hypothetical protein
VGEVPTGAASGGAIAYLGAPRPNPASESVGFQVVFDMARLGEVETRGGDGMGDGGLALGPGIVRLRILDVRGRTVRVIDSVFDPGRLPIDLRWDLRDSNGVAVPSGVYWVLPSLEARGSTRLAGTTRSVLVLR